ncbi:hypothetical protein BB560_004221 [Smittium megazygosporum]|uniref:TauD/TfdA-like domain-containing protein n=1 Tax=Smittium megazygosporum TaxID=133381 RepID=A0A2T9Z9V0_9FUNG|nr:hypothetical protein BB560_004221 [Smittium megazygosporum]
MASRFSVRAVTKKLPLSYNFVSGLNISSVCNHVQSRAFHRSFKYPALANYQHLALFASEKCFSRSYTSTVAFDPLSLEYGPNKEATVKVALQPYSLVISKSNKNTSGSGETYEFPYSFLRDSCRCSSCVHSTNYQKLFSSARVPPKIKPVSVKLEHGIDNRVELVVEWKGLGLHEDKTSIEKIESRFGTIESNPSSASSAPSSSPSADANNHVSRFNVDWLVSNSPLPNKTETQAVRPYNTGPRTLWDGEMYSKVFEKVDYSEFMETKSGYERVLKTLGEYGLAFLKNIPNEKSYSEKLISKFGPIMHTFYGKSWDVISKKQSENIAYTDLYLGLHMDLCYFSTPPGIQMLSCLENTTLGGESIFVDSFKAANIMKKVFPKETEILTKVDVPFHYDHYPFTFMYNRHKTISFDKNNEVSKVFYAPMFQAPLKFSSSEECNSFLDAFSKFEDIIYNNKLFFETKLENGTAVLFHNTRVLHSRRSFDSSSGNRHFLGAYLAIDDFNNQLRLLYHSPNK